MDPDQGRRSVRLGLDPDCCLHVFSLSISEEVLDDPQENCCCFNYINNIYVKVLAINIVIYLMLNKYIVLYLIGKGLVGERGGHPEILSRLLIRERSGSVVECLTRD